MVLDVPCLRVVLCILEQRGQQIFGANARVAAAVGVIRCRLEGLPGIGLLGAHKKSRVSAREARSSRHSVSTQLPHRQQRRRRVSGLAPTTAFKRPIAKTGLQGSAPARSTYQAGVVAELRLAKDEGLCHTTLEEPIYCQRPRLGM